MNLKIIRLVRKIKDTQKTVIIKNSTFSTQNTHPTFNKGVNPKHLNLLKAFG